MFTATTRNGTLTWSRTGLHGDLDLIKAVLDTETFHVLEDLKVGSVTGPKFYPDLADPESAFMLISVALGDDIEWEGDVPDLDFDVSEEALDGPNELDSPSPSDDTGGVKKHAQHNQKDHGNWADGYTPEKAKVLDDRLAQTAKKNGPLVKTSGSGEELVYLFRDRKSKVFHVAADMGNLNDTTRYTLRRYKNIWDIHGRKYLNSDAAGFGWGNREEISHIGDVEWGGGEAAGQSVCKRCLSRLDKDIRKHAAPIHPGTGSGQDVHGRKGGGSEEEPPKSAAEYEADYRNERERNRKETYGLPDLPPSATHWILTNQLEPLESKVEQLSRKAKTLGIADPITMKPLSATHTWVDEKNKLRYGAGAVYEWTAVKVEGSMPEIAGYRILARLEHPHDSKTTGNQPYNLVHRAPGVEDVEIPKKFLTAGPDCEVCHRDVDRKNTFLVLNEKTDHIAQVGRNDLKVYTGYEHAEEQSKYVDLWAKLDVDDYTDPGDTEARGRRWEVTYDPKTVLELTASSVRQHGFRGSKAEGVRTKGIVTDAINRRFKNNPWAKETVEGLKPEDTTKAEAVLNWVRNDLPEPGEISSDYLRNLKIYLGGESDRHGFPESAMGYVASATGAYDREMGYAVERELKDKGRAEAIAEQEFVGTVGEKHQFEELTVVDIKTGERTSYSGYGQESWRMTKFRDPSGNQVMTYYDGQGSAVPVTQLSPKQIATFEAQEKSDRERMLADRKHNKGKLPELEANLATVKAELEALPPVAVQRPNPEYDPKVRMGSPEYKPSRLPLTEAEESSNAVWRKKRAEVNAVESDLGRAREGAKVRIPSLDNMIKHRIERETEWRQWRIGDRLSFLAKVTDHKESKYGKETKVSLDARWSELKWLGAVDPGQLKEIKKAALLDPEAHRRWGIVTP